MIVKDRYLRYQTWVCQSVSNEVLLAWFKFQAKISSRSGVCVQGEWQKYTLPSPLLSQDEGLRTLGIHSISARHLILGVNTVMVSYLIDCDSLLLMRQILLQNATAVLL